MNKFIIVTINVTDPTDHNSDLVEANTWQEAFDKRDDADYTSAAEYVSNGLSAELSNDVTAIYGGEYTIIIYGHDTNIEV